MEATVTTRCIFCGAKREIRAYEVPEGEMPKCHECHGIMVPVKATAQK